ncbi:MAG: TIGR04100 family radical SAM protein [Clostridia bacterium]|nr:TIGR04100 family radical SAM protein [Clostridia bacterium]
MTDIVYTYGNQAYLNITNACPCRCTFCIRNNGDSVGEATTLWFEHSPTIDEIKSEIDKFDFEKYNNSIIICGYGEPTCALDNMIEACKHLKSKGINIRLNTNGLSDLINKRETAKEICEVIDSVSISLNAPTKEKYNEVTKPSFGEKSFDAMLKFAKECKEYGIKTILTVVDVISKEDIEDCKKLCEEIQIPLRVREYTAE